MRHGNYVWGGFYYLWSQTPILPMRHGNLKVLNTELHELKDSDPTYEAWKPLNFRRLLKRVSVLQSYLWGMETQGWEYFCGFLECYSNPTYEVWKRNLGFRYHLFYHYSNPTYEVWKPTPSNSSLSALSHSNPTYEVWKLLPPQRTIPWCRGLQSYLWGMETHVWQFFKFLF